MTKYNALFDNELLNSIQRVQKQFDKINNIIPKALSDYSRLYESIAIGQAIFRPLTELSEKIESLFPKTDWNTILDRLNANYADNLMQYAKQGWYFELDAEVKLDFLTYDEFAEESIKKINSLISEYYEENFDRILKELIIRHPNRKNIIKEIRKAYKSQSYYIAIVAILSQVDGICHDRFDKLFFIRDKKDHLPLVSQSINEQIKDDFVRIFMTPILNLSPIFIDEKFIESYPCKLNRHGIIHGKNTEFGTKENFLKCLSLLKYVSDLLGLINSVKIDEN